MKRYTTKSNTEPQAGIRRPAVYFILPFAAGLVISIYTDIPIVWSLSVTISLFIANVVLRVAKNRFSHWAIYFAAFAAGYFLHSAISQTVPKNDVSYRLGDYRPISAEVTGIIRNDPEHRGNSTVFSMNLESISSADFAGDVAGKCRVTVYEDTRLEYGDRVCLSGELSRPTPARFHDGFDYGKYLKARGINSVLYVDGSSDVIKLGRGPINPIYWISYETKGFIARSFEENVGGRAAGFVKGLLLGARSEIDYDIRDDFKGAGVFHVLAVSGQHVNLLALVIFLSLGAFGVPRRYTALAVMIFLPVFAILTGLKPPVIRAALMGELVLLAVFAEREVDLFNSLASAAIFILAFNPLLINDVSFLLSFSASIGIALGYRPTLEWFTRRRFPQFFREIFAAAFAAQLGVLPLQLWYFYRLTPVSLLSNLVVVPLSALTMVFGLLTAATAVFIPPLAKVYGAAAFAISELVFFITDIFANGLSFLEPFVSGFPPSIIDNLNLQFWVGRPSIIVMLLIWAIPVILFIKNVRIRKLVVFASLGLIAVSVWYDVFIPKDPELEITFLPVGKADATVIITPNNEVILVDTGWGFAGRSVIEPYFHSKGIDRIDVMCITHSDLDHIGGAYYLTNAMPVDELWLRNSDDRKSDDYLRELAKERDIKLIKNAPGNDEKSREIDGVYFNRLWPPVDINDKGEYSENDRSTVLLVRYGEFRALLTGDAEKWPQERMVASEMPLEADLLKAPHHGIYDDLDIGFAETVSPVITAITCKYDTSGRSPDPCTINLFDGLGSHVVDTGRYGAINVVTDGMRVKLRTAY